MSHLFVHASQNTKKKPRITFGSSILFGIPGERTGVRPRSELANQIYAVYKNVVFSIAMLTVISSALADGLPTYESSGCSAMLRDERRLAAEARDLEARRRAWWDQQQAEATARETERRANTLALLAEMLDNPGFFGEGFQASFSAEEEPNRLNYTHPREQEAHQRSAGFPGYRTELRPRKSIRVISLTDDVLATESSMPVVLISDRSGEVRFDGIRIGGHLFLVDAWLVDWSTESGSSVILVPAGSKARNPQELLVPTASETRDPRLVFLVEYLPDSGSRNYGYTLRLLNAADLRGYLESHQ